MTDFTAEALRMDAIRLIEKMPAEEMNRVWKAVNNLYEELRPLTPAEIELKKKGALEALERIRARAKENRVKIPANFDYKQELEDAFWERYEEKCRAADEEKFERQAAEAKYEHIG